MDALFTLIPIFTFVLFIAIFVITFISIIGAFSKQRKITNKIFDYTGQSFKQNDPKSDHGPTHFQQQDYQMKYARKNKDSFSSKKSDNVIKDKPLSEAEKNVLYGK